MKDHEIAKLVNDLVSQSNRYHNHQCLREVFSQTVNTALKQSEPMDNNKQAVDIKGYRELSVDDKMFINHLKEMEVVLMAQLKILEGKDFTNKRSLAIAKTEIQTGFMWAIRAIARPNGE